MSVLAGVSLVSVFLATPGSAWSKAGGAIGATVAVLGLGWAFAAAVALVRQKITSAPLGATAFMVVFTITSSLGLSRYLYLVTQVWNQERPVAIAVAAVQRTIPVAQIQVFDPVLSALGQHADGFVPYDLRTGDWLLAICTVEDTNPRFSLCAGYLLASVDNAILTNEAALPAPPTICFPQPFTVRILRDTVVRQLRERPEALHFQANQLVLSAYLRAFRCPQAGAIEKAR